MQCVRKYIHDRKPSSRVTNPSASTFRPRHRRSRANFSFAHVYVYMGRNVKVAAINVRSTHFSHHCPALGLHIPFR